ETDGGDRQVTRVALGHRNDLDVRGQIENPAQQVEVLGGQRGPRGAEIEQHYIGLDAADQGERGIGGLADREVEIGKYGLELARQGAVALQDEQFPPLYLHSHGARSAINTTRSRSTSCHERTSMDKDNTKNRIRCADSDTPVSRQKDFTVNCKGDLV